MCVCVGGVGVGVGVWCVNGVRKNTLCEHIGSTCNQGSIQYVCGRGVVYTPLAASASSTQDTPQTLS